jgi:hypothetical protein
MTTSVTTGLGSTFKLADASAVQTLLGEVVEIPVPNGTTDLIDATHMGTTGFRDFIQSPLRDGEEADIVMNWIPNSASDLLCLAAIGATRAFEIVVPAGTGHTYKFAGSVLVRNYTRNNVMDDKRTCTLTVKWVSAITETYT